MDNCFLVHNTVYTLTIGYIWQVPHKWIYGSLWCRKKNRNLKSFEKQGTGSVVESLSKSKPSTPRSVGRKYKNLIDVEVSANLMVRVSKCPHNRNYFLHGALLMRVHL